MATRDVSAVELLDTYKESRGRGTTSFVNTTVWRTRRDSGCILLASRGASATRTGQCLSQNQAIKHVYRRGRPREKNQSRHEIFTVS